MERYCELLRTCVSLPTTAPQTTDLPQPHSPREPFCLSIYLSIYEIYIAPLQGNYSEAPRAQARVKIKVKRNLFKEVGKSPPVRLREPLDRYHKKPKGPRKSIEIESRSATLQCLLLRETSFLKTLLDCHNNTLNCTCTSKVRICQEL